MVASTLRPDRGPAATTIPDAHAAFRADFLKLIDRIGLAPDEGVMLVEASSGHPFETCTPAELVPLLSNLLALAQRTPPTTGGLACDA